MRRLFRLPPAAASRNTAPICRPPCGRRQIGFGYCPPGGGQYAFAACRRAAGKLRYCALRNTRNRPSYCALRNTLGFFIIFAFLRRIISSSGSQKRPSVLQIISSVIAILRRIRHQCRRYEFNASRIQFERIFKHFFNKPDILMPEQKVKLAHGIGKSPRHGRAFDNMFAVHLHNFAV